MNQSTRSNLNRSLGPDFVSPDMAPIMPPSQMRPGLFSKLQNPKQKRADYNRTDFVPSNLCSLKNVDQAVLQTLSRAGIIFYTYVDQELHICLGLDRKHKELTDFAGIKKKSTHEAIIACAIRECNEESRNLGRNITAEFLQDCMCIYNTSKTSSMIVIFVELKAGDPFLTPDIRKESRSFFHDKALCSASECTRKDFDEMSDIIWFSEAEAKLLFPRHSMSIHTKGVIKRPQYKVYSKLRKCVTSVHEFDYEKLKRSLVEGWAWQ